MDTGGGDSSDHPPLIGVLTPHSCSFSPGRLWLQGNMFKPAQSELPHGRFSMAVLLLCCCSFAKSYLTLCDPMNGSTPAFTALQLSSGVCSNSRPPAPVKGGVLAGKDVKNLNFQRTAGPWDGTKESSCARDSPQKVDTPCCGQNWCPRLLDQNVQGLLGSLPLSSVQWSGHHPSPWRELGCLRHRMEDSLTCLPQILSEGEKNCGLAKPL